MKQVSLNFGAIRDSITRYASKEIIAENGDKSTILNSFLKFVKESYALKIQYLVFKNLEDSRFSKERLAERCISQNLKLLEGLKWNNIIEANRRVRVSLLEDSHVAGNKGQDELYEHIHTLIESSIRKGFIDLDRSENSYEVVLAHLMREATEAAPILENTDGPKLLSWNFVTKLAVDNFNDRYAHLNESERALLKVLLSPEDKKLNHFEDLKKETSELIDSALLEGVEDKTAKESLIFLKEKINSLSTNGKNIDEAIINCSELKEELLEMKK